MHLRRLVVRTCFALSMGLLPISSIVSASELSGNSPAAAAIGVARMSEQSPMKQRAADGSYSVFLDLEGTRVELHLELYSLRRPSTQAFVEGPGGVGAGAAAGRPQRQRQARRAP